MCETHLLIMLYLSVKFHQICFRTWNNFSLLLEKGYGYEGYADILKCEFHIVAVKNIQQTYQETIHCPFYVL